MDLSAAHGARGRSERGRAQAINTEFVAALGRDDHDHVFVVVVVRRLSRERGEAHRTLALRAADNLLHARREAQRALALGHGAPQRTELRRQPRREPFSAESPC